MKLVEIYIKVFMYIIAALVIIEFTRPAFWLMNQPNSYSFYVGFTLALILALATFKILFDVITKAIPYLKKTKKKK
jgi:hypothetical protein